jgi:indoleamine 2,3-dioxygenase
MQMQCMQFCRHIPSLSRDADLGDRGAHVDADTVTILKSFDIDVKTGFLPPNDPLKRLTRSEYLMWEDIADELPKFLGVRFPQVREILLSMPKISTENLTTRPELERAHFLLALFAHSFVWGGFPILDYIPENIAVPLCEVSRRLEVPPLLCYFDIVLNNWRKLDSEAVISMGNLATVNNFFDGRDESWFYLITVEIEFLGAAGIGPLYQLNRDIARFKPEHITLSDREFVKFVTATTAALHRIAEVIASMTESMSHMREGCDPYIFFHRVRPFLAGWKHNPAVPHGVRYMGVKNVFGGQTETTPPAAKPSDKNQPEGAEQFPYQQFSGGSAAQSTLLPFFDILLGVDHRWLTIA